jgi:hypothetical protein
MSLPKSESQNARTSKVLAAAGAYDSLANAPTIDCRTYTQAELFVGYTRANAAGQVKFKIYVSDTPDGTFKPRTIDQGDINPSGNESYSHLYASAKLLPVSPGAAEEWYTFLFSIGTAKFLKIIFAEAGFVAGPGTVEATVTLGMAD